MAWIGLNELAHCTVKAGVAGGSPGVVVGGVCPYASKELSESTREDQRGGHAHQGSRIGRASCVERVELERVTPVEQSPEALSQAGRSGCWISSCVTLQSL